MGKKESTHGGKRPGAGRPRLAPEERRDEIFALKLTGDEKRLLDSTEARNWARTMLIREATKRAKKLP